MLDRTLTIGPKDIAISQDITLSTKERNSPSPTI